MRRDQTKCFRLLTGGNVCGRMENVKEKQHAGLLPVRSGDKAVPSQLPSRESFVPRGCPLPAAVACAACLPTNLVRLPRTPVARFCQVTARFCRAVRGGQSAVAHFCNPVAPRCKTMPAFCDLIWDFWTAIARFWSDIGPFCADVRVFWNVIARPMTPVFNHLHENRRKRAQSPHPASGHPLPSDGRGQGEGTPDSAVQIHHSALRT